MLWLGEGALGPALSGVLYGPAGGIAQPALMARWGFVATFLAAAGVAMAGAGLALARPRTHAISAA